MNPSKILMFGGMICSGAGMILNELAKNKALKEEVAKQVAKAVEGLK